MKQLHRHFGRAAKGRPAKPMGSPRVGSNPTGVDVCMCADDDYCGDDVMLMFIYILRDDMQTLCWK